MLQFIARLFGGNKSKKDVQELVPIVNDIRKWDAEFSCLSHDELRAKTAQFKQRINDHIAAITEDIHEKMQAIAALPDAAILQKDSLYTEVEQLRIRKNKARETVLMDILPEAFAVMRQTASRFTEHDTLICQATDYDRQLAAQKPYVTVEDDRAIYATTWSVRGNDLRWNMIHYDVQLIGGIVLHQGKIAEMATGEGKTLVSTLPAYLNALAGEGVHIITVNDYLAKRDREWNGPLFEWLGLRVDCIDAYPPHSPDRKQAYLADITYGTNNEFGFDYLRDNMVSDKDERVQRKHHHYAMIDEVDSVLIDDARTPLIISGPVGKDETQEKFVEIRPHIEKIVEAQRACLAESLNRAKQLFSEGKDGPKDGGLALYRVYRGLPKYGALIKFLSEPGIKARMHKSENFFIADNQKEMRTVDSELFFYIDEKNNSVDLTEKGIEFLSGCVQEKNFFTLPDLSIEIEAVDRNTRLTEVEKAQHKDKIASDYAEKASRIHTVQQLLKAYTLFEKDIEYVVVDGQVKIVDEQTGRIMEGRRYSDGLHQALEAKEKVTVEASSQTYATITLQNYFRMFHKLAGMTGTAQTEATEFWQIYKLDVVSIPTNVPVIRKDNHDLVFKTKREKYKAVIDEIEKLSAQGRPVLVGTTSVEVSELLSRTLRQRNIAHNVLNAKQHMKEAQVVAEAGLAGKVTIATNMAGRGTDIKLSEQVKQCGGLAIVGTERHESRRVDRQLRGRSGRQGDPGSSQFFVSLEDDLMRMFGSDRIAALMDKMGYKEGEVIQHSMVTRSIERAQKKVEANNFSIRKRLLEYDDVMNKQRNIIYKKRSHALFGDQLALDVDHAFYSVARYIVEDNQPTSNLERLRFQTHTLLNASVDWDDKTLSETPTQQLCNELYTRAIEAYTVKKDQTITQIFPLIKHLAQNYQEVQNVVFSTTDTQKTIQVYIQIERVRETEGKAISAMVEKDVSLLFIDELWKEHLKHMDDLRQSVQNAVYEQKDPLVIYKAEAFHLFEDLNTEITQKITSFLSHYTIPLADREHLSMTPKRRSAVMDVAQSTAHKGGEASQDHEPQKQSPHIAEPKIGRNEPCPCGSGKKYKHCHGR